MLGRRPDGTTHVLTEDDIRRTMCGLWIGDETWRFAEGDEPSCETCRPAAEELVRRRSAQKGIATDSAT
jgi:hypothetical protein